MTNHRLSMTNLLTTLNHSSLTFHVVFNKTLRESEATGASKPVQVSQPMQTKQVGAGGPVQAKSAYLKQYIDWLKEIRGLVCYCYDT